MIMGGCSAVRRFPAGTLVLKNQPFLEEAQKLATLAQLVEQQTENLRVWSSILRGGITQVQLSPYVVRT